LTINDASRAKPEDDGSATRPKAQHPALVLMLTLGLVLGLVLVLVLVLMLMPMLVLVLVLKAELMPPPLVMRSPGRCTRRAARA
jgi:hypothetical protein